MKRSLTIAVALLVLAALAALIVRLRSPKADHSALDTDQPMTGSLDTWPAVPVKNVA